MTPIEWYYARGNKQMGPVTAVELKRLAAAGELHPDDLVWREGLTEWAPAERARPVRRRGQADRGRGNSLPTGRALGQALGQGRRTGNTRPSVKGRRAGPARLAPAGPAVGLAPLGLQRPLRRHDGPNLSDLRAVRPAVGDGRYRGLRGDRGS